MADHGGKDLGGSSGGGGWVVVWTGKGGMGRGKEAMIKGGCNFLESGVRVLL